MQSLLSVLQRGCATLIVVQRSNARSACSLGFMRILSKCVTLARLQMEAATPAAASPSRTTICKSRATVGVSDPRRLVQRERRRFGHVFVARSNLHMHDAVIANSFDGDELTAALLLRQELERLLVPRPDC